MLGVPAHSKRDADKGLKEDFFSIMKSSWTGRQTVFGLSYFPFTSMA